MNKQRKTSHILNVFQYDADGHVVLPASLTLSIAPAAGDNNSKVPTTAWTRSYVSSLSYLTGNQTITVNGDASGSGTTSINLTLANTAVTPGVYGSTTLVPVVTVDSKGRITNVSTAAISGSLTFTGDVTGTGTTGTSTALTLANSGVTIGTYTKVTVDSKGRVTVGANATTSDISEGTRLYYTDARVLAYLGANNYATQSYVGTQIANLVASSPATLDTLNELAAALGNDPSFATTTATSLGNRLRVDTAAQGLNTTQQSNGRTNLGLGTAATSNTGDFVAYRTFGTAANNNTGDFAAASHTHSIANVTGLQTALDGKQATLGGTGFVKSTAGTISYDTSIYLTTTAASATYPTLTGGNASGTWAIDISGFANQVSGTTSAGSEKNLIYQVIADNDIFRLRVGGASNAGWVELATADDGTEPIYVRQYTGPFTTIARTATILDGSGNTSFPGTVTAPTFSGALSGNASTSTTAGSISGFNNPTTAATANTIVYRDGSGDINGRYLFGSYQNSSDDVNAGNITYIMAKFGDNYHRSATAAKVQAFLGLGTAAYQNTGAFLSSSGSVTVGGYLTVNGAGTSSSIYMNDSDEGNREIHCNSNRIGFLTQAGAWGAYCDDAGNWYANNLSGTNTGDQTNISGNAATATTASSLAANTSPTIQVLNFTGVGTNSGNANQSYAIYQEGGAWSPPFPDLCIGYHTGIKLGAYFGYNGIRFFNNSDFATQTFSVNDGDNHVRVAYNLYVGGTISGSNLSGTNTGDQTNISGNAATAGTATNLSGAGGSEIRRTSYGTSYTAMHQMRETSGYGGNTDINAAPALGFHWGGVVASSILMEASGRISIRNNPGTSYEAFIASTIYASSSFQGNLTGNVTGNVSGTSSNITAYTINQSVGSSNAPTFAGITINGQTTINRHIDANTTWGGCTSIFVGWSGSKVILGNNANSGHDYALNLGCNTVVSTNPFFCYQDITAYSDARVKDNVKIVDNALEKIKSIRGVTFTRNDTDDKTKRHAGVIAQEVLAVLPEAVSEDDRGHYSVAYGNLNALLIEAIKEQQLQIEELKNKLDSLIQN